jgi:DnaJ-class molecular chaperone
MNNQLKKIKSTCTECNGDGVTYTIVNDQDLNDPFSLQDGAYEDECNECGGTGYILTLKEVA